MKRPIASWAAIMIDIHQLSKKFFTGGREIVAVDRLSLSVRPGEVYGLLGPNGAGKTTTIRMIIGLLEPDDGYAEVAGFRTSEAPDEVKARVGLVSAGDGVYPWLTVREMLLFFADLYGVAAAPSQEKSADALRAVGFDKATRAALRDTQHRPAAAGDAGPGADPRSARDVARRADARPGRVGQPGCRRLHRPAAGPRDCRDHDDAPSR